MASNHAAKKPFGPGVAALGLERWLYRWFAPLSLRRRRWLRVEELDNRSLPATLVLDSPIALPLDPSHLMGAAYRSSMLPRTEIVIVDEAVANWQSLVADLPQSADCRYDVYRITDDRDGVSQIADILDRYSSVDAVHILSHGAADAVQLGSTRLDVHSLTAEQATLERWRSHLAPGADLLFYACDAAAGSAGQAMFRDISVWTGADVAASTDLTGASDLGGNWTLEFSTGLVQASIPVAGSMWEGLLNATMTGPETQVNTTTSGNQQTAAETRRAVAMAANGDYVVVWSSQGQDGDGYGVYGQRFSAAGVAQGGEFQVNTNITGDQRYAAVAMKSDGSFIVTWSSKENGTDWDVYARRYAADGATLGNAIKVNKSGAADQMYSTVAVDSLGNFIVTWSSNQNGLDWDIYARRFNSSGTAQGNDFLVNQTTGDDQEFSQVGVDASGNFVIAWASHGQVSTWDILARRYSAAGAALSGEFLANTRTQAEQIQPWLAVASNGDFVITWSSKNQDSTSGYGVYGQMFKANGTANGKEFRVNTTVLNDQQWSSVAYDGLGNFIVTWSSNQQENANDYGIYAQRYDSAGTALGSEFHVNSTTADQQQYSSVAASADGHFTIVWSSKNQDGNGFGVYAQNYMPDGITLTAGSPLTTSEAGGTASFQVVLDRAPIADVVIQLTSSNPNEGQLSANTFSLPPRTGIRLKPSRSPAWMTSWTTGTSRIRCSSRFRAQIRFSAARG